MASAFNKFAKWNVSAWAKRTGFPLYPKHEEIRKVETAFQTDLQSRIEQKEQNVKTLENKLAQLDLQVEELSRKRAKIDAEVDAMSEDEMGDAVRELGGS